jgi:ABC-2 type transport system permease protein
MSQAQRILAIGVRRGRVEVLHLFRNPRELASQIIGPAIVLMIAARLFDGNVEGTDVPVTHLLVAGFISMAVFQTGLVSLPQILVTEREEGTLLRLRATPRGLQAYLVSKVVVIAGIASASAVLMLAAGALVAGSPLPSTLGDWLTLVWVLGLGFVTVALLGACIGAVLPNPREALLFIMVPAAALLILSGIFFPVTTLPEVLQWIGQAFPLKWMAQGVRSAMLPDSLLAAETGGSWQHLETLGVLLFWCAIGAMLAPRLLRRMTARESGSRLDARREQASQRVA